MPRVCQRRHDYRGHIALTAPPEVNKGPASGTQQNLKSELHDETGGGTGVASPSVDGKGKGRRFGM